MGTYCELYVAGYPIYSTKSEVDPMAMTIFRESDRKVFTRKRNERNKIAWGHADWEDEEETVFEYSASSAIVKDRLRVMGFTKAYTEADFLSSKEAYLSELREMNNEDHSLWDEEITLLERSSFRDFLNAMLEILQSNIHTIHFAEKVPTASQLAKYMVRNEETIWGFPCSDIRSFFRALIEIVPAGSFFQQDITDLVVGGYYGEQEPVSDLALSELKGDYSSHSKIIILTEGPTDSKILKLSLDYLFPHLSEYYSFMDLAVRAPGGAGSLVQVVKSFAGAGIENRIIGIFDNDTAGHSASSILQPIQLPPNIRVMHYPDISFASTYPTIGPNGFIDQDINGKACSIELYFGRDVLTKDGKLVPVQWKGLDERIGNYQGEIQLKDDLKNRYIEKIERGKRTGSSLDTDDWASMRALFEVIFDAFN